MQIKNKDKDKDFGSSNNHNNGIDISNGRNNNRDSSHSSNNYLKPSSPTISPALIYFIQNSHNSSNPSSNNTTTNSNNDYKEISKSTPTFSSPKFESNINDLKSRPLSNMFNNVANGIVDDDNSSNSNIENNNSSLKNRQSIKRHTKPSLQLFNSPTTFSQSSPTKPSSISTSSINNPSPTTKTSHNRNLSTDFITNKIQGWMPNFSNSLSTPQINSETTSLDTSNTNSKREKVGVFGKALSSLNFNDIRHNTNSNKSLSSYRIRNPNNVNDKVNLVFGRKLHQCVSDTRVERHASCNWNIPTEAKNNLPCLIIRCFEHLSYWGAIEEGIFRISGKTSHILQLRREFDTGADLNLKDIQPSILDPHAVASVFKAYLRELPNNILDEKHIPEFNNFMQINFKVNAVTNEDTPAAVFKCNIRYEEVQDVDFKLLRDILTDLPVCNYWLLRLTIKILRIVSSNSDKNKMTLSNVLLVLCPSVNLSSQFVTLLVKEYDNIYGNDDDLCLIEEDDIQQQLPLDDDINNNNNNNHSFNHQRRKKSSIGQLLFENVDSNNQINRRKSSFELIKSQQEFNKPNNKFKLLKHRRKKD